MPTAPSPTQNASPVIPLSSAAELIRRTREFAQEVRWRSWWHLWSTMGITGCVFAATVLAEFLLPIHWTIRALTSLIAGLLLVRMFIIYHDHNHGTILRRSKLADATMLFYGLITLNPPSTWKRSHNHHHKNNSKLFGASIGSYPIMTTETWAKATRWERLRYAATRHPLTILSGYVTIFLYGMCLRPFLQDPGKHIDCGVAIVLQAGLIVILALVSPALLFFSFLAPITFAAALGAYLFYSQHNFPGVKIKPRGEWDFVHAAIFSSSYTNMSPLMRWFTGNIGYHHVHHLNARIPFYRLPEAMARIRELQLTKPIHLGFLDIYRCFRLKLWDSEKERMVSFKGA